MKGIRSCPIAPAVVRVWHPMKLPRAKEIKPIRFM